MLDMIIILLTLLKLVLWVKDLYWRMFCGCCSKSHQSCPTLCDPTDSSPLGSSVPGILQARTLEWVAGSFSSAWKWKPKVESVIHAWFSDTMDCSLPGSSVHGIFQARVLEWGAIAFSWRMFYVHSKRMYIRFFWIEFYVYMFKFI